MILITDVNLSRFHRCGDPSARRKIHLLCPTKGASASSCRATTISSVRRHTLLPRTYTTCGMTDLGTPLGGGVIDTRDRARCRRGVNGVRIHVRSSCIPLSLFFARCIPATIYRGAISRQSVPPSNTHTVNVIALSQRTPRRSFHRMHSHSTSTPAYTPTSTHVSHSIYLASRSPESLRLPPYLLALY